MEHRLPIRCRAEEVAEQLRLVVTGMGFLADRSWDEVGWGRMRIELLSLWRVELLLEPERRGLQTQGSQGSQGSQGRSGELVLSRVEQADAPDGRCWTYGCQRDDWTLGPGSRLVEPIQFLSCGERRALTQKLQQATCWPEPLPAAAAAAQAVALVLNERIRPHRPPRRRKHRCGL